AAPGAAAPGRARATAEPVRDLRSTRSTTVAPQGRGRRLRPGGHPRVWALIFAMGACALVLTFAHVRHLPALGPHPRPAWWLLAVAFAVAELCVVHVEFRRNVH